MGLEKEKKEKLEEEGDADDGAKSVESSLRAFCSVTHTHSPEAGNLACLLAYSLVGRRAISPIIGKKRRGSGAGKVWRRDQWTAE